MTIEEYIAKDMGLSLDDVDTTPTDTEESGDVTQLDGYKM